MENLLDDLREDGVLVYLDDILVHAQEFPQCLNLLREVLQRLRDAGMVLNLKKCTFFLKELLYLGHLLTEGKRRPNLSKTAALKASFPPKTVTEVRFLLGLCSYYRDYIEDFAEIAAPISDLLRGLQAKARKKKSLATLDWTPACTSSVEKILSTLRTAFLIQPNEFSERSHLRLETDASGSGFGAVLTIRTDKRDFQPLEFLSKRFNETQQRWPTHEREAYAIIYSLDHWADFCRGREVDVVTDHANLRWIFDAQKKESWPIGQHD